MRKIMYVEGMSCDHCKKRVEAALTAIDNVIAEVNLPKKTVTVDAGIPVEDSVLTAAVTEAGYTVVSIEDAAEKKGFFTRRKK